MTDHYSLPLFPPPRDPSHPFDPPPLLIEMMRERPVTKVRNFDGTEAWLITRFADVKAAFMNMSFSSDPRNPGYPEKNVAFQATVGQDRNLRTMDPPEHTAQREMIQRYFVGSRLKQLRSTIQERVDQMIDDMLAKGPPADLVADLAFPVPTMVICELLGIPYEDRAFFGERAAICFSSQVTVGDAVTAGQELFDYTAKLVKKKDENPESDLLSLLVVEQMREGKMTSDEIVELVRLLLIAGHETTANTISISTLALLLHPEQYQDLRDNPGITDNAVEELLRYTSTPHLGRRRAAIADVEVGGQLIKAGEGIIIANNVADRDETIFPDPHKLDLRRANARANVAFGYGPHRCLGQMLSRVELQLVHETLCRRIPTLRLAVPVEEIEFIEEATVYALRTLPVTW